MTTLTEDLIILAVGLKPKAGPNTGVLPLQFRFGVRGGELVTLAMAGRVAVGNGRIEVRDPAPLADPALNHALSQLVASGGADLGQWMVHLPPMHVTYYFERLRAAGALRPVQVRLLLIAKRTGYLLVDQAYFHHVRMRLHTAVTSPGPVDAGQAALAGLVYAAGLARLAYPGAENAAARNRLEQLAGGDPALAGSAAAGAGARGAPVQDDPNRWAQFSDPAGGIGGAAIEAAVRSATEAAVHAVVSSISAAVHSGSDTGTHSHSHHSSGSGSSDSAPSHHH